MATSSWKNVSICILSASCPVLEKHDSGYSGLESGLHPVCVPHLKNVLYDLLLIMEPCLQFLHIELE